MDPHSGSLGTKLVLELKYNINLIEGNFILWNLCHLHYIIYEVGGGNVNVSRGKSM